MTQPIITVVFLLMCVTLCHSTTDFSDLTPKDVVVVDLKSIQNMSLAEFAKRKLKSLAEYVVFGDKNIPDDGFVGRCIGIGKKIRQMMPFIMIGGGVIITKLGFLVLFSLKTLGLVGLILLINVATAAGKIGSLLAHKKDNGHQNLHFHVAKDEHLHGAPPGWDDRIDQSSIESHDLYNLYDKLRFDTDLRRYLASKH